VSWRSIGETVDKGTALLVTLFVILVAPIVFIARSTSEDAIWDCLGETFHAMGRGDLALAWGVLGFAQGVIAIGGFLFWALAKVRDPL